MKTMVIIPARGGSKGIPHKNIALIGGKPLIVHSIEHARTATLVDKVVVSTDSEDIASVAKAAGTEVIMRPPELAQDHTPTEPVIAHALQVLRNEGYLPDRIVLLQPTSPIRSSADIDNALRLLEEKEGDSLLSVCRTHRFLWRNDGTPINYDPLHRPRRQDREPEYAENGSIYVTKREIFEKYANRLGGKIILYEMPEHASFEIDTHFDIQLTEFLLKHRARERHTTTLQGINSIVFDVDGVFTDGSVYTGRDGEFLKFSRIDGKGIELLHTAGIKSAVLSAEDSPIVRARMEKLGIHHIMLGVKDKRKGFEEVKKALNASDEEVAFAGDDVQDIDAMRHAAFSACPSNAREEVKQVASYVSSEAGGNGFVRELCDMILAARQHQR